MKLSEFKGQAVAAREAIRARGGIWSRTDAERLDAVPLATYHDGRPVRLRFVCGLCQRDLMLCAVCGSSYCAKRCYAPRVRGKPKPTGCPTCVGVAAKEPDHE